MKQKYCRRLAEALSRSTKPLVVYYCKTYDKCNKVVSEGEGEMEDVCCIPQPGLRDWSDHHTSYSF